MAARGSQDLYGEFGSVPNQQPLQGTGAGPLSVRASPEDFGAQVGQGLQKVGEAGEGVASQYGGLIMETAANQAELHYIQASGDLKAKYQQYEGLQAEAMRPQYEAELQGLHNEFRNNLPLGAQRMFDGATIRSLGNQTSEYSSYAASQVKDANLKSNDALADASIAKAGNLPTVTDPTQFGEANGTIIHAANAVADIKGWAASATGTDPETGKLTFSDDTQSQTIKSQYEQYLAEKQAKLYLTAAKTVADNHGATAAADWAQAHWNMMPDVAKVQMNQFLAPKMKNETISGSIANQNSQVESGWQSNQTSSIPSSPTETAQKSALDVIRQNEGYTGKVAKDSNGYNVLNGINEKSFPTEYAETKRLLDTQGKAAADKYADDFYQKNILDKYDIKSLPPATQSIVADGLVNHGTGEFGQKLIQAAKDGQTPEQLIQMRRDEYQRLAQNPAYTPYLKSWEARLDKLEQPAYSAQGAFANKKDYLESVKDQYVSNAVNDYNKQYPDDYYGAQTAEKRATAEINKKISLESGKLKSDSDTIEKAIGGSMTKGVVPTTIADLQAIPGMRDTLDRVQREQGDFYKTIDTRLAKASHGDLSVTSPNAYDAALTALDRTTDSTRQGRISYLSKGLGSDNPGISISQKDFNTYKPAVDFEDNTATTIRKKMMEITGAGGNIDGKGQERALQYYDGVSTALKANGAKGDKKESESDVINEYNEKMALTPPSAIKQIENWAASLFKNQPKNVQVIRPDGTAGTIPAENLEKALAAGYKKAG